MIHGGPPYMVEDGMVFGVDAANPRSYPGSGATWYDLSDNGHHLTMTGSLTWNGMGFSNWSAGSYFEDSDFRNSNIFPDGDDDRTIIAAVTLASDAATYRHIAHYGTPIEDQAFGLAIYNNKPDNNTWNAGYFADDITLSTGNSYFIAHTYADQTGVFMVNNLLSASVEQQGAHTAPYTLNTVTDYTHPELPQNNSRFRIGCRIYTTGETFEQTGIIHSVYLYNRVLTPQELERNFISIQARLGLFAWRN